MATIEPRSIFREQRAAKNQSLFREINERIEPLNKAFTPINRLNDFVCECANESCTEAIRMTVDEYEVVRQHPARFFVWPADEHVGLDVERVLEKTDRYWVVEKFGHVGSMAAKLDPRSRDSPE